MTICYASLNGSKLPRVLLVYVWSSKSTSMPPTNLDCTSLHGSATAASHGPWVMCTVPDLVRTMPLRRERISIDSSKKQFSLPESHNNGHWICSTVPDRDPSNVILDLTKRNAM